MGDGAPVGTLPDPFIPDVPLTVGPDQCPLITLGSQRPKTVGVGNLRCWQPVPQSTVALA